MVLIGPLSEFLANVIRATLALFTRVVTFLLWPFVYILSHLIQALVDRILPYMLELDSPGTEGSGMTEISTLMEELALETTVPTWSFDLLSLIKITIAIFAAAALAWFISTTLRRLRNRLISKVDHMNEGESADQSLTAYLGSSMREMFDGFLNRFRQLRPSSRFLAALRIRRIYAELIRLSTRLGQPRSSTTTPLEFLVLMQPLFPFNGSALEKITQSYLRVRYGEYPETEDEVKLVESAWELVRVGEQRTVEGAVVKGRRRF